MAKVSIFDLNDTVFVVYNVVLIWFQYFLNINILLKNIFINI